MTPIFNILWVLYVIVIYLCLNSYANDNDNSILFVILSQQTEYYENKSESLKLSIEKQAVDNDVQVDIFRSHIDFSDILGGWAVWPLLPQIVNRKKIKNLKWLFFCEEETEINLKRLLDVLNKFDHQEELFLGHPLKDQNPTIIHHYAFANENPSKFLYPDFAAGFAFSWPLAKRLVTKIQDNFDQPNFSIDAKHELAMLIWENGAGHPLTEVPELCTIPKSDVDCATKYVSEYMLCQKYSVDIDEDLLVAVKTFHKHHKSRIVVIKRTWAKESQSIEYYSDVEDKFVPTIDLGLGNTERGHCGKTMGIIKRFYMSENYDKRWLAIVDDDTILSVLRLAQFLRCFNINDTIIIGERYGYGFNQNGRKGYDYPTGGSGMIFSPSAVSNLAVHCRCPSLDSPDDMILGMCAQNLHIPIIHSAAFHQARPVDYCQDYLNRIKPISFHKHWEIDPYVVYADYLEEKTEPVVVEPQEHQQPPTDHVHNVHEL